MCSEYGGNFGNVFSDKEHPYPFAIRWNGSYHVWCLELMKMIKTFLSQHQRNRQTCTNHDSRHIRISNRRQNPSTFGHRCHLFSKNLSKLTKNTMGLPGDIPTADFNIEIYPARVKNRPLRKSCESGINHGLFCFFQISGPIKIMWSLYKFWSVLALVERTV